MLWVAAPVADTVTVTSNRMEQMRTPFLISNVTGLPKLTLEILVMGSEKRSGEIIIFLGSKLRLRVSYAVNQPPTTGSFASCGCTIG